MPTLRARAAEQALLPRTSTLRRGPVPPTRGCALDVLVLPGEPERGLEIGCGPDSVIMDGDNAWRLNRTTGRFEPVDRDDFACAD